MSLLRGLNLVIYSATDLIYRRWEMALLAWLLASTSLKILPISSLNDFQSLKSVQVSARVPCSSRSKRQSSTYSQIQLATHPFIYIPIARILSQSFRTLLNQQYKLIFIRKGFKPSYPPLYFLGEAILPFSFPILLTLT